MHYCSKLFCLIVVATIFLAGCKKEESSASPNSAAPEKSVAAGGEFGHQPLSDLLAVHVNEDGWVDYPGLKNDRAKLDAYLATLASANVNAMPNSFEKLAFWINGYNGFVLAGVLDDVIGKVKSVHDIEKNFFDVKKYKIVGEELTLNQIEQRGRDLKDPRIHFAVNCASASCPKLKRAAYSGATLDKTLSRLAQDFLADQTRGMQYDVEKNEVSLSPIFKWYAGDFTKSDTTIARAKAEISGTEMLQVAKQYLPFDVRQFLDDKKPKIKWMEYDWTLNSMDNFKSPGETKHAHGEK